MYLHQVICKQKHMLHVFFCQFPIHCHMIFIIHIKQNLKVISRIINGYTSKRLSIQMHL